MRKFLRRSVGVLSGLLMFGQMGYGQAYVITLSAANAGNPGGVRTAYDYTTTGGTSIWTGPQSTQSWSSAQTIPFSFDFYGTPVTKFIVASNGLLSFDTTNAGMAVNTALNVNASLPNSNLPDKTVAYFWDDFSGVTSSSDDVYMIVEGTAPNRQLWILNYSMQRFGTGYAYWAMVLEETTNKIYAVDMNYYYAPSGYTPSATVGIQVNSTTAYQSSSSPNTGFNSGGSAPTDNEYFEFAFYGAGSIIPPTNVGVTNIQANSAVATYDLGTSTAGEIEYGLAGFTQGAGTTVTCSGSSHTLTSLTDASSYEFYIRSSSGGSYSNWVGPIAFTTPCLTASMPYSQNFDTWPLICEDPNAGTVNWTQYGGDWAEANFWSNNNADFIMDMQNVAITVPAQLTFVWSHLASASYPEDDLAILAKIQGATTWDTIWYGVTSAGTFNSNDGAGNTVPGTGAPELITLPATYVGQTVSFQINAHSDYGPRVWVDDFVVEAVPSCPLPQNFTSFNLTAYSVDVTFSATGSTRVVEWGPAGYVQGTGTLVTTTNDTINVTTLPPGTCLDFYVQSDCSAAGNGTSAWAGPYSICTPCLTASLPYVQDFNSWPLICEDPAVGGQPWTQSGNDWARANLWSYNNTDFIMSMRRVNVSVPARLKFKWSHYGNYATSYPNDDLAILARPADSTAWDTLWYGRAGDGTLSSNDGGGTTTPGSGVDEIILLPSHYTGQEILFEMNAHSSWGPDVFVNDFVVEALPACLEPIGFTTTSILPDSVAFYFSADSTGTSWNIEWGPVGYTPGTGAVTTLYNDTTGLGGLSAATCYDVYIQTICGTNGQSILAGPYTFCTACDTLPIPWNEGFESIASTPDYPACWLGVASSSFYLGTASGTSGTNPGPNSGSNYLQHKYSFNNEWWSFTPEFHLQAGQSYEFSFWYQTEGTSPVDQLRIAYGSGQDAGLMTYTIANLGSVNSSTYTQAIATFIPPVTGVYHIGVMSKTAGFSGGLDMDDFQLRLDPTPCPTVSSLSATIISENEVDLIWGATSAHSTFDIEWGPQGFTPATGLGRMVTGLTSATLNIDTLSENTCYDFYVTGHCAGGSTVQVGPYTWCTPCSASPLPYTEDFAVWTPTCVDPTLGDQDWDGITGWARANFWSYNNAVFKMKMRNVDISSNARIKFKWSHNYMTSYPNDALALLARTLGSSTWDTIWFKGGADLNSADGATYNAPGSGVNELVALNTSYTGSTAEFMFRARSGYGPSCFVDNFVVEVLPSCPEPYSISYLAASATVNSGTVYFVPGGSANQNIAYGPAATTTSPPSTFISTTNDTVTLTGLTDNTTYNVWVRDSCGAGDVSVWTGPVSFTTLCLPQVMPYWEQFGSWPPACMDVDNGTAPWLSNSGWAAADFWSKNNVDYEMTTPLVILTDSAEMSFKWSHSAQYASSYPYDSMQVRVRKLGDPWTVVWSAAGASFNSNDGAGTTSPGSGVLETIGLTYAAGDTIQVGVFAHSDYGPHAFVDDIQIYKKPACAAPTSLGAYNATSSSADLFWTPGSANATSWYVEYGGPGFLPGQGTSVLVTNDTTSVSGLSPASAYCFYVTEICPTSGDSSSVAGPYCFGTLCPAGFTAPYFTDMEVLAPGQYLTGSLENCWTFYNNGPTIPRWETEDAPGADENSVSTGPDYDHTLNGVAGGMYVFLECSGAALGDTAVFEGPWVDVSSLSVPELSYWYHMYGQSMGNLYVEARDAASMTWIRVDSIMGQVQTSGSAPWNESTVILNTFSSDTIQVRFIGEAGSNFYSDMSLDDISIREAPTCPKISSISFTNVTTTGSDANWIPTVTGQTYEIEYGAGGFTLGSGTMVSATGTSYTFSGMTPNLRQEMYIRPVCGAGDTGLWTGPFMIEMNPIPCDDFEAYNLGLVDVQSVLWQGWNGTSAQDGEVVSYMSTNALHIYNSGPNGSSDIVGLFDTIKSGAAVLSFDFALATGAGGYYNILHEYGGSSNVWALEAFVDANGTVTVNEGSNGTGVIGTYQINTTGWNTIEHYIDLDNDTAWISVNGTVTSVGWRFSLGSFNKADRFNAVNFYSSANAGQTPNYYVDNFCVCPSPSGFSATNVTCTTVELDWTSSEPSSTIEYGPSGFTPGAGTFVQGASPYTITGLTVNTAYDFYVGDVCNGDTMFVGPLTVTPNGSAPTLNLSYNIDSVNLTAGYVSLMSGATNADSVYWDFDDNMFGSATDTSVMYTNGGTKTVVVTAYNDCGSTTDSVSFDLNISIDETVLGRSLTIYPNPSSGVITLDFTLESAQEVNVSLLGIQGKMIMTDDLGRISSFNGQYDFTNLPKGVYIVRVQTGSQIVNRRVTLH